MTYLKEYKGLNEDQKQAADVVDGPALVLAGAGSGKTKAMTVRISKLIKEHNVDPRSIFCATFTNKAANEMKDRIENMIGLDSVRGLWMGTFHSMCVRILRQDAHLLGFDKDDNGSTKFTIFDTEDQKELLENIIKNKSSLSNIDTRSVISYIDDCKNNLWDPSYAMEHNAETYLEEVFSIIYDAYQKELLKNNAMDFGDLIMHTVTLLRDHPDVQKKWQNQFQYILVDEFQDANYSQLQLILLLGAPQFNIFVIGDDAQAIYGFRGSDISIILGYQDMFPSAEVIKLGTNYRSTETIVDAGAAIISNNPGQLEKDLKSFKGGSKPIVKTTLKNETHEANFIATLINSRVKKGENEYGDFSVLYRNNFHSRQIEESLVKLAIPYVVVGGNSFLSREEIKDTFAYLRLAYNSKDDVAFSRIVNKPRRKIGEKTLSLLSKFADQNNLSLLEASKKRSHISDLTTRQEDSLGGFLRVIEDIIKIVNENNSPSEIVRKTIIASGLQDLYKKHKEKEEKLGNLNELVQMFKEVEKEDPSKDFEEYLQELSLLSFSENTEELDAVKLMTIHASKGLEFPVCILSGWNEGTFPSGISIKNNEVPEERRVAYVAVTRAEEELIVTSTEKRRDFTGKEQYVDPSRFLGEIPEELSVDINLT